MSEPSSDRVAIASSRLQEGLRSETGDPYHNTAVRIADRINASGLDLDVSLPREKDAEGGLDQLTTTADRLRRVRKIAEIIEDEMEINVGHRKLTRAATDLAKLSSMGAMMIAANNLIHASQDLIDAYDRVGRITAIDETVMAAFTRAVCIFVIECFLFTSPLNYQVAWRGTRYVNNRYLYRLQEVAPNLYRYVLSEVHYVIRDIVPAALRSAVEYAEYLVSVSVTSFQILWKHMDQLAKTEIPGKVDEIITEFQTFVEYAYDVTPPEIDLHPVYTEVLAEAKKIAGVDWLSVDDLVSHADLSY